MSNVADLSKCLFLSHLTDVYVNTASAFVIAHYVLLSLTVN